MTESSLPSPGNITHLHLLGAVHTQLLAAQYPENQTVRILDVGCGNGLLISYLHRELKKLLPSLDVEFYGFDVDDHGVQSENYFANTLRTLNSDVPNVDWSVRLSLVGQSDAWPYAEEMFDAVLSNQVLEHVNEPNRFFGEVARVMKTGGFSLHLYPLKHYIKEGHLFLPWVHRIQTHDLLTGYIRFLSKLGMGKYKAHNQLTGVTLDEYAEAHADYMHYYTSYMSYSEAISYAKEARLRVSFRYTKEFYTQKLRQILGRPVLPVYQQRNRSVMDRIAVFFLKYVSCVTLFMEKKEVYKDRNSQMH